MRSWIGLLAVAAIINTCAAANYTVGGPNGGWDLITDLDAWGEAQQFVIGDTCAFVYLPTHNVLEVSETDYDSCNASNPVKEYTGGSTVISLTMAGDRYFICGIAGHCIAGMKVRLVTLPSPDTASVASFSIPPMSKVAQAPALSPSTELPAVAPVSPVPFVNKVPASAPSGLRNSMAGVASPPEELASSGKPGPSPSARFPATKEFHSSSASRLHIEIIIFVVSLAFSVISRIEAVK